MRRHAALGLPLAALLLTLGAPASAATVTLAWDANAESDIAGYRVYYDTDAGPPYSGTQANEGASPIDVPLSSLADPTMPQIILSGLPSCTVFFFAVTAYNTSMLESAYSGEISSTITAKPTVTAVPEPGALHLSWSGLPADDSGSIPAYHVNYDTDSGLPYSGVGADQGASPVIVPTASLSTPSSPSFDLTGLTPGVTYYLVVEAACDDGSTRPSTELSAVPDPEAAGGAGGASTSGTGGGATTGAGGGGATTSAGGASGGPTGPAASTGNEASSVSVGAGASASETSTPSSASADSGCGCRIGDRDGPPLDVRAGALALAALAISRRLRRSRSAGSATRHLGVQ